VGGTLDGVAGAGVVALPPRILNITTPQVGHLPLIALRPFFMTSSTASAISFFDLHLTQYPSGICVLQGACSKQTDDPFTLGGLRARVNWETRIRLKMLMAKHLKIKAHLF
jgi:hypothetical protein